MQIIPTTFCLLLLLTFTLTTTTTAYVLSNLPTGTQQQQQRRFASNLKSFVNAENFGDSNDENTNNNNLEAFRLHLEFQYGSNSFSSIPPHAEEDAGGGNTNTPTLHAPTDTTTVSTEHQQELEHQAPLLPLTSLERERRLTEIELLQTLANSDQSLFSLWKLWEEERGRTAARQLAESDALAKEVSTWQEAEGILTELVDQYGDSWPEPANRLATLYYLQNRLEESLNLLLRVLRVRPWHFGALSGIVMVHEKLGNPVLAREYAGRRLPKVGGLRRIQWVEHSVRTAKDKLEFAEEALRASFGEPDQHCVGGKGGEDWMSAWE